MQARKRQRVVLGADDLQHAFDNIDTNNSGYLNVAEFVTTVVSLDIDVDATEARRSHNCYNHVDSSMLAGRHRRFDC